MKQGPVSSFISRGQRLGHGFVQPHSICKLTEKKLDLALTLKTCKSPAFVFFFCTVDTSLLAFQLKTNIVLKFGELQPVFAKCILL